MSDLWLVNGPRGGLVTISATAYQIRASDNNLNLCFTPNTAVTVTVPQGLPVGFSVTLTQQGTGTVTVAPGSAITLENLYGQLSTAGQWGRLSILCYDKDSFVIDGDVSNSVGPGSYQYATPLTGTTVAMAVGATRLLINPAGTLAALTVDLPTSPLDGQVAEIMTSQQLTALTIASTDGSTVNGVSGGYSMSANTGASWVYRSSNTTWFVRY